ncbi:MAG: alkaline phosphatase family protein [Dokdonella sp.]
MNATTRRMGCQTIALFTTLVSVPLAAGFEGSGVEIIASVHAATAMDSASIMASTAAGSVHRFDHVVIAIMENTGYSSIIGDTVSAPYINSLLASGVSFSDAHGVTHPSQPNYVALFSGQQQGITDDSCPHNFTGVANLGSQLIAAGLSFTGYSETMPSDAYGGCSSSTYARKHNPWVNFDNVPSTSNRTFAAFPTSFADLPTLSIVVPNLCNDMHDCSISTGDSWLQNNLAAYVQWAKNHNSLFILTWDEDNFTVPNQIPMVFAGSNVIPGSYSETVSHYGVLRTLEDMYGLSALANAATAVPITDVWDNDRIFAENFDQ